MNPGSFVVLLICRARPRRRKLHIPRFAVNGKALSFRCASSPTRSHFVQLRVGSREVPVPLLYNRKDPGTNPGSLVVELTCRAQPDG